MNHLRLFFSLFHASVLARRTHLCVICLRCTAALHVPLSGVALVFSRDVRLLSLMDPAPLGRYGKGTEKENKINSDQNLSEPRRV